MMSNKRRAASRSNGQKSRGPRTSEGKARSSRNAWRHGLSTIHRHNRAYSLEIEQIANALCGADNNPLLVEQSLIVAESEVVLRCVDTECMAIIERLRDLAALPLRKRDSTLSRAQARIDECEIAYEEYCRLAAKFPNPTLSLMLPPQPVDSSSNAVWLSPDERPKRDEHDALQEAMPDLMRLYRYERRAWSRRMRAFREIFRIKAQTAA